MCYSKGTKRLALNNWSVKYLARTLERGIVLRRMNNVVFHYFRGKGLGEQVRLMLWEVGVEYEELEIRRHEGEARGA